MSFSFTNRETYLAYVANWKADYHANSESIRTLKRDIKKLQRAGDSEANRLQAAREYLRRIQRMALAERAEAKLEAQQQYLAAKNPEQAAA